MGLNVRVEPAAVAKNGTHIFLRVAATEIKVVCNLIPEAYGATHDTLDRQDRIRPSH